MSSSSWNSRLSPTDHIQIKSKFRTVQGLPLAPRPSTREFSGMNFHQEKAGIKSLSGQRGSSGSLDALRPPVLVRSDAGLYSRFHRPSSTSRLCVCCLFVCLLFSQLSHISSPHKYFLTIKTRGVKNPGFYSFHSCSSLIVTKSLRANSIATSSLSSLEFVSSFRASGNSSDLNGTGF